MAKRAEAPCRDCPSRHYGCHNICSDYKEFRDALDRDNELRRQQSRDDEWANTAAAVRARKNKGGRRY